MLLTGDEDDTAEDDDDTAEDDTSEDDPAIEEGSAEETAEEDSLPAAELSAELSGVLSETGAELPPSPEEDRLLCVISSEASELSPLISISRSGSGKRMGVSP